MPSIKSPFPKAGCRTLFMNISTKDDWKLFKPKFYGIWVLTIDESEFDSIAKRMSFTYDALVRHSFNLNIENAITKRHRNFKYQTSEANAGDVIDYWISEEEGKDRIDLYVKLTNTI